MNGKKDFNRMQFLERVVTDFINKTTYKSLKTAYDGYIKLILKDSNPQHKQQNSEKIKILEGCFDRFNNSDFKKILEDIKLSKKPKEEVLFKAVAKALAEDVLGDKKRKYDMSDRYCPEQITPGSTRLIPTNGLSVTVTDMLGCNISVQKIGALTYGTAAVTPESISKYNVRKTLEDSSVQEYDVFTFIDLNMLKENSDYRDAVLGELLSKNNIELSNTNGYIGEIVSTKNSHIQLKVGEQRENAEKFYRYQVSQKYALVYDPQDLSAVVYHARSQELNVPSNAKNTDTKDDIEK